MTNDISWCIVHTHANKEVTAELNLLNQGYQIYLPKIKKMHSHARKIDEVIVPLFPRYVFVGINL